MIIEHWRSWVPLGELPWGRRRAPRWVEDEGRFGGVWVLWINPEAGKVKTKQAREVPLHPQLVEMGFPASVVGLRDERLFLVPDRGGRHRGTAAGG